MSIYLYIKTHRKTGLRYLGKTNRNPHKYIGSGTYWRNHLKKHGNDVHTMIDSTHETIESLRKRGLELSEQLDIVNSLEWANLIPENGMGGAVIGHSTPKETRLKLSISNKKVRESEEAKRKLSQIQLQHHAEHPERRLKAAKSLLGQKHNAERKKVRALRAQEQWSSEEKRKQKSEAMRGNKNRLGTSTSEEGRLNMAKAQRIRYANRQLPSLEYLTEHELKCGLLLQP